MLRRHDKGNESGRFICDYNAADDDEIDFEEGDTIENVEDFGQGCVLCRIDNVWRLFERLQVGR